MSHRKSLKISCLLAVALSLPVTANAEWRCDCTKIAGSCDANVTVEGNWVHVTSDKKACSRVDYYLDGQPFVTVVVEGEDRQDWLARTENPEVLVKSCQVCRDNLLHEPSVAVTKTDSDESEEAETGDTASTPIIRIEPVYPVEAGGISGYVLVELKVTPYGDVETVKVVEAQPAGIFEDAAVAAVSRWRYGPGAAIDGGSTKVTEKLEFSPGGRADRQRTGQARSGVWRAGLDTRNHCVKESKQQDFVDMTEIGLVNVCSDPVVVFSCVQGSGPAAGRWLCDADTDSAVALVRPDDRRAGQEERARTADGLQSFRYLSETLVYPAATTQYWWIACSANDLQCRDAARAWADTMENSPVSVDPRRGFDIAVASSY